MKKSIQQETAEHIAQTFNSAPSHEERNYESEHTKEVMLHAVTKFELENIRKAMAYVRTLKVGSDISE